MYKEAYNLIGYDIKHKLSINLTLLNLNMVVDKRNKQ